MTINGLTEISEIGRRVRHNDEYGCEVTAMVCLCIGPGSSYDEMCEDIAKSFQRRQAVPFEPSRNVRMVGIFFFRPMTSFGAEITASLGYFHHRSGDHINFYCAGFEIGWEPQNLQPEDNQYFYSDSRFEEFRKGIQRRSKWRYSGGADLLLINARYNGVDVTLDFRSAIAADLVKMKAAGAFSSVDGYIEQIIQYSETQDGVDPTWGFSEDRGKASIFEGLKGVLISGLPKGLQKESERAFFHSVSNLSL